MWLERFALDVPQGVQYTNTVWTNRDLVPIPAERRLWNAWGYIGYWTVGGSCVTAWTLGSTMLAHGSNAPHAIGACVIGAFITGLLAVGNGLVGDKHHIGYTVSCRATFGMRGSYIPIVLRCCITSAWFGLQAFWGGQAVKAMIGALIPGFITGDLDQLFSRSSHLAKNDFIGFWIWMVAFVGLLFLPPEKMQLPFLCSFVLLMSSCFALLGWTVSLAGGAGPLFSKDWTPEVHKNRAVGWTMVFGVSSVLSTWGTGCLSQSDWTRYAKRPSEPRWSQMIAAPLTIILTACMGIIVTSASMVIFNGKILWNPIQMLPLLQKHLHHTAASRAGVFFIGLGFAVSQLALALVLNSVSTGMDLAGLFPKYISITRGAALMVIIGIAIQPWQLVANSAKFLTVLAAFGIFVSPITGVMLADLLAVRRNKFVIHDLYHTKRENSDEKSIYWFTRGFNIWNLVAIIVGMWPMIPGLANAAIMASDQRHYEHPEIPEPLPLGWRRVYNIGFFVGFAISFTITYVAAVLKPPPGVGIHSTWCSGDETDSDKEQMSYDEPGTGPGTGANELLGSELNPVDTEKP